MSATCEWSLVMTGRSRKKYLNEILEVLYRIEKVDAKEGAQIFRVTDGKNFFTKVAETAILTENPTAKEIFGDNYLEPRVDVCKMIAHAVPLANWVIECTCISESGGVGCESYMQATLSEGILEIKTDMYVDSVTLSHLVQLMDTEDDSYESFCACYHVDDSIDEDTYEEYKYDDCEDDFYYNAEKKAVSKRHLWEVESHIICK